MLGANTMRQVSVSQLSTMRWSFFDDVIQYALHGFESIGVWREKVTDLGIDESIDLLYEKKLSVSSVHWAGAFTGSDGKSHCQAIDDAIEAIDLASRLGADCLIIYPGSRNGHTHSHSQRLFRTALEALIPISNDYGVRLAIEPMPDDAPNDWTFYETIEQSLELLNQFGPSRLGLVLDLFHVGSNQSIFENLDSLVDSVALVQLSNRSHPDTAGREFRCPLKSGKYCVREWIERFQAVGYQGCYEIEMHGPGMQFHDYVSMLRDTKEFFSQRSIQNVLQSVSGNAETQPLPIRPTRRD
jgi:sugar phosphate isomerase/epimerase